MSNKEWASEQLENSQMTEEDKAAVMELLTAFWNHGNDDVLEAFEALVREEPLEEIDTSSNGVWLDAKPGNLYVRDVVRVRDDAYTGQKSIHNGRVGVVVGIRYGNVSVNYTDRGGPASHFTTHRLPLLEKRY